MFDQPRLPGIAGSPQVTQAGALHLVPFTLGALSPGLARLAGSAGAEARLVCLDAHDTPHDVTLGDAHPADRLLGVIARSDADGLAMIEPSDGKVIVSVVYRNGTSFRADVTARVASALVVTLYGSTDRSVDAMRRALGVVTAPPTEGTAWYWLKFWLDELGACPAGSIDVLEAARWHPGIDPDEIHDNDDPLEVVDFCLERLYEHARVSGWGELRASTVAGETVLGVCSAELAAWFDTGSFSRHLADRLAPPIESLDALVDRIRRRSQPGGLTPQAVVMLERMIAGLRSTRTRCVPSVGQERNDSGMSPVRRRRLLR